MLGLAGDFLDHVATFAHHFKTRTRDCSGAAKQYLSGLMQAGRKNMERMAEVVPDADDQVFQHFLSNSPWDERAVIDQVACEADIVLGGRKDSCLLIDESGFQKKGCKSVGVKRQWLGREGKVDNGQVGVFAALAAGDRVTPIDVRLYLPSDWADDPERCREADVPEQEIRFRSKHDLALEMVEHARSLGVRYKWVGADALYGEKPGFLNALEDMGQQFLVDVHKNQPLDERSPSVHIVNSDSLFRLTGSTTS